MRNTTVNMRSRARYSASWEKVQAETDCADVDVRNKHHSEKHLVGDGVQKHVRHHHSEHEQAIEHHQR